MGSTSLAGLNGCINLTEIASPTKNSFKNITNFSKTFAYTGVTSIPEDLFANINWDKQIKSSECFNNWLNLRGNAPQLWLEGTNFEKNNYQGIPYGRGCFYLCEGLNNYSEIT